MKHKILSSVVVPTLLILTSIFSYLTLKNNWNFEIASYFIFLFTLIYILTLERIIPLKQEWKPNKTTFWTDIKHFVFSAVIFDALGKVHIYETYNTGLNSYHYGTLDISNLLFGEYFVEIRSGENVSVKKVIVK